MRFFRRLMFGVLAFWWITSAIDIPLAKHVGRRDEANLDAVLLFVIPCFWDLCRRKVFDDAGGPETP